MGAIGGTNRGLLVRLSRVSLIVCSPDWATKFEVANGSSFQELNLLGKMARQGVSYNHGFLSSTLIRASGQTLLKNGGTLVFPRKRQLELANCSSLEPANLFDTPCNVRLLFCLRKEGNR